MLQALFDFSFSKFITAGLIRVIYGLGMAAAAIGSLSVGFGLIATSDGFVSKVLGLVAIPLLFLLITAILRMWLEIAMVLFKIAENTRETADRMKNREPATF